MHQWELELSVETQTSSDTALAIGSRGYWINGICETLWNQEVWQTILGGFFIQRLKGWIMVHPLPQSAAKEAIAPATRMWRRCKTDSPPQMGTGQRHWTLKDSSKLLVILYFIVVYILYIYIYNYYIILYMVYSYGLFIYIMVHTSSILKRTSCDAVPWAHCSTKESLVVNEKTDVEKPPSV